MLRNSKNDGLLFAFVSEKIVNLSTEAKSFCVILSFSCIYSIIFCMPVLHNRLSWFPDIY